tara:strand:- start:1399 stop:1536 length:138 start_codon:yes stop_codon:yes gene_type:complete
MITLHKKNWQNCFPYRQEQFKDGGKLDCWKRIMWVRERLDFYGAT